MKKLKEAKPRDLTNEKNLQQDVFEIIEKIKTEAADATNDLITAEQTLAQKYGQAAAHTVEIILLAAILGKLFGVI